jgi:hypothetical protein
VIVKVAVPAPEMVDPEAWRPSVKSVVPIRQRIVGAGAPVIVDVNVTVLPTQLIVLVGALTVGIVFTVMFTLEGEVSAGVKLSTAAFTVAVPPVPSEVNNAVAVPLAWIVDCCPERLPKVELQVTGNPINTGRFDTEIASSAELERKLAVTLEVLPRPADVLQIGFGEAVDFS